MQESLNSGRRGSKLFSLASVMTTGEMGSPTTTASPPLSPSTSMSPLARPPTHGGGPLSSHPTTPIDMPGAWVSSSDLPSQAGSQAYIDTPPSSASPSLTGGVEPARFDSFRTPLEPASASNSRRSAKGVRKLLSLSSLRNSFLGGSSSRKNSLHPSTPGSNPGATENRGSVYMRASSANYPQGIKRSASDLTTQSRLDGSNEPCAAPLRKKKSASWFKRKSQIFLFGQDGNLLDSEAGEQDRPIAIHHPHLEANDSQDMGTRTPTQTQHQHQQQQEDEEEEREGEEDKQREARKPEQSYEPPQRYQHYGRPEAQQSDSRPQSYQSYQSSYDRPQSSRSRSDHNRRQSVLLPELDELVGGGLNGGSLGGEEMFANIGR